jgi:hypothetical protein
MIKLPLQYLCSKHQSRGAAAAALARLTLRGGLLGGPIDRRQPRDEELLESLCSLGRSRRGVAVSIVFFLVYVDMN